MSVNRQGLHNSGLTGWPSEKYKEPGASKPQGVLALNGWPGTGKKKDKEEEPREDGETTGARANTESAAQIKTKRARGTIVRRLLSIYEVECAKAPNKKILSRTCQASEECKKVYFADLEALATHAIEKHGSTEKDAAWGEFQAKAELAAATQDPDAIAEFMGDTPEPEVLLEVTQADAT